MLAKNPSIYGPDQRAYAGGPFVLNQKKLEAPLHWRKPARVGLQFMGDWMHDGVHLTWIDQILEVISACPQHTFFSLTKRPEALEHYLYEINEDNPIRELDRGNYISNLWLGVTVCNQEEADTKIPELLKIPGFKKWVSVEPMLGPIKFRFFGECGSEKGSCDDNTCRTRIDFVVAGAETGPGARPAHPDWLRSLRDQCQAAGVPFFLKRMSDGSRELDGQEWSQLPARGKKEEEKLWIQEQVKWLKWEVWRN
jgi:protein gp37